MKWQKCQCLGWDVIKVHFVRLSSHQLIILHSQCQGLQIHTDNQNLSFLKKRGGFLLCPQMIWVKSKEIINWPTQLSNHFCQSRNGRSKAQMFKLNWVAKCWTSDQKIGNFQKNGPEACVLSNKRLLTSRPRFFCFATMIFRVCHT